MEIILKASATSDLAVYAYTVLIGKTELGVKRNLSCKLKFDCNSVSQFTEQDYMRYAMRMRSVSL